MGKFCPKPKRLQLWIEEGGSSMNREQYKKKYGNKQIDNQSKNKKCWYKDCGYCKKYHTKCFNCHTND